MFTKLIIEFEAQFVDIREEIIAFEEDLIYLIENIIRFWVTLSAEGNLT